jgi:hypothetical protein
MQAATTISSPRFNSNRDHILARPQADHNQIENVNRLSDDAGTRD